LGAPVNGFGILGRESKRAVGGKELVTEQSVGGFAPPEGTPMHIGVGGGQHLNDGKSGRKTQAKGQIKRGNKHRTGAPAENRNQRKVQVS